MDTKKCKKCDAENPLNAEFCAECGENIQGKIDKNDSNPIRKIYNDWNNKDKQYKTVTGILGCCAGVFIIIIIFAAIFPTTALTLENATVNIDNQTTEYTLKGTTDPGATIKISSKTLNLDNVEIKADTNGKFEYKLQIPLNVNETTVDVTAKVQNKSEKQSSATIKRPATTQNNTNNTKDTLQEEFNTYSGLGMTFNYPKEYKISAEGEPGIGQTQNGLTVRLNLIQSTSQREVTVQKFPDDSSKSIFNIEAQDSESEGYESHGQQKINGLLVNVYKGSFGWVYIFQKGSTTFEILGFDNDRPCMDIIAKTIKDI